MRIAEVFDFAFKKCYTKFEFTKEAKMYKFKFYPLFALLSPVSIFTLSAVRTEESTGLEINLTINGLLDDDAAMKMESVEVVHGNP